MADTEIEGKDLAAIVADELRQAQTFDQSKRALALEYMRGVMSDLPARVNGSSQTSRDVADTISWILPGVVRVFTASDQMVEFEATQEGGEQAAEEASDYTNYSFFRENDGYRVLYNATYDAMLMGNGAVCSYWCPQEDETKLFKNKTEDELAALLEEGWQGVGVQPVPGTPREVTIDDPAMGPMPVALPTFTVKLQKVTERGQIRDMTLKPENLLLSSTAITIETARMAAYLHDDKTRSDLMEMADEYGWDADEIENLPRYSQPSTNEVSDARRFNQTLVDNSPTKSNDLIDLYEVYLRVDMDGDGETELLQVWYAGNAGQGRVLGYEEWEDDVPFTDIPCYPVPHLWEAESVFDRTADIQRVKTTLLRQALDNTYAVNNPGQEVEEGSVLNPDALVNRKFGGILWKKRGSQPIIPQVIPYIADKAFAALEYMDTIVAKRTGVSKTTMALDPEALQNQTATASQAQRDAGYSQIELIARNMAELGWAKFFAKRRNLAKKYIQGQISIPSRNGDPIPPQMGPDGQPIGKPQKAPYRTIQPEAWGDDMAVSINTGLGTGSRDRDMAMLAGIKNGQMMMAQALQANGMSAKAIEFIPKIIKTAIQEAEASGLKNPASYYPEFTDEEVKAAIEAANQPKPDPAIMLEQEKGKVTVQVEQAKIQAQAQLEQQKMQLAAQTEAQQSQAQVTREAAQLQADLATKEADRNNQILLARQQAEFDAQAQDKEIQFKLVELSTKTELEREKMANSVHIASMKPKPEGNKPAAQ